MVYFNDASDSSFLIDAVVTVTTVLQPMLQPKVLILNAVTTVTTYFN